MADDSATSKIDTVIFDVGNVLYRWDLRCLFEKLIHDVKELDWFLANVVTPQWHFQHDEGRPLDEMVAERIAEFPKYRNHIESYRTRFNETIPGPVDGSLELVERLAANDIALYGITNFGAEFWLKFHPTAPIFEHFRDIIVSGEEQIAKPDPAIYQLALNRFGIAAAQALFIDDRADNIAAAESLGFKGHIFTDAPKLEILLQKYNLL